MNELTHRVFCRQCGAVRIRQRGSRYAVCPNGHGRLVPRFTRGELHKAIVSTLPEARQVARNKFVIEGHVGVFTYRNGSGRRRAEPGTKLQSDELVARHVTRTRQLVRVFARRPDHPSRDPAGKTVS